MYSSEFWHTAKNFAPDWDRRSEVAAKLLAKIDAFNLFELGSGPRFPLKVALADSKNFSSYLACDLIQWDSSVMILDLNKSDDLKLLGVEVQKIGRCFCLFHIGRSRISKRCKCNYWWPEIILRLFAYLILLQKKC